jgi:hypothetical protein
MKRIEILTDVKDAGERYYKGEQRMVTPEKAGYFCGLGWARDVSGEIETGAPDTSEKQLDVHSVRHVIASTKVGS